MECVAPLADLLIHAISELELGHSTKTTLISFINNSQSKLSERLSLMIIAQEKSKKIAFQGSQYEQFAFQIFWKGLQGYPINNQLHELHKEVLDLCREDMNHHLESMPFKMLLPLLFFAFPSFLILILGPLINQLINM